MNDDKKTQETKKPTVLHLAEIPKDMTKKQRRTLAEKFAKALMRER